MPCERCLRKLIADRLNSWVGQVHTGLGDVNEIVIDFDWNSIPLLILHGDFIKKSRGVVRWKIPHTVEWLLVILST